MKESLGLIAVVLAVIGHTPYITDILCSKTKPHVFTWVIWGIVTLLAFFGQWQKGGGPGSWTTGVTGGIVIIIALLSLKKGSTDITKSDAFFFICALLAVIPWVLTKDPTISIVLITLIDASAFIPTIRKTLKDPKSETLFTYALNIPRHSIALLALSSYNLATALFPLSVLIMNSVMTTIILLGRQRKRLL